MKYPALQSFEEVLPMLERFDAIIDVRSEGEFAEDHIPGAINCPVLNNQQRERVGTLYKQVGAFEAKKVGAALVAQNIAAHLNTLCADKPREWKPLVYCWRGGNRSGAMAHILAKIGWPAIQLDGGYKAYRQHINAALSELPTKFHYQVIAGPTGSGKSELLRTLAQQGAQVLDLEQLASHRGSVLGDIPSASQPSQKAFESSIWQTLRHFDPSQAVFVESESKKVGNLRVPDALMERMRASACIAVNITLAHRVALLMREYAHFVDAPEALMLKLDCLLSLHGREKLNQWKNMATDDGIAQLVEELLVHHYDPAYQRSIDKNFTHFSSAKQLTLQDISAGAFDAAAKTLIDTCQPHA